MSKDFTHKKSKIFTLPGLKLEIKSVFHQNLEHEPVHFQAGQFPKMHIEGQCYNRGFT